MSRFTTLVMLTLALQCVPAFAEYDEEMAEPDYASRYAYEYEDARADDFEPTQASFPSPFAGPQPASVMGSERGDGDAFLIRSDSGEAPELPLD
jgi:hypothetical protein